MHCLTPPIPNRMLCVACLSRHFTPRGPLSVSAITLTMAGTFVPEVSVDGVLSQQFTLRCMRLFLGPLLPVLVVARAFFEKMNSRRHTDIVTKEMNRTTYKC